MDLRCQVVIVYFRQRLFNLCIVKASELTIELCFHSGVSCASFEESHFAEGVTRYNVLAQFDEELAISEFECVSSHAETVLSEEL